MSVINNYSQRKCMKTRRGITATANMAGLITRTTPIMCTAGPSEKVKKNTSLFGKLQ